MSAIRVRHASFTADRNEIYSIRYRVFVVEQAVPVSLELDELDPVAMHVLAYAGNLPVGTGRVTCDGCIGRMAVLRGYRRMGYGRAIIVALLNLARSSGVTHPYLSAQCHAIPFYEKIGFAASGPVYDDAGIDHRHMEWVGPPG